MWIIQRPLSQGRKSEYLIAVSKIGPEWQKLRDDAMKFETSKLGVEFKVKNKIQGHVVPF